MCEIKKKKKKLEERVPGIKDFLWDYMIKKIFPSISSGVLVGRNSTFLTQIDYTTLLCTTHCILCFWWPQEGKREGEKYEHTAAWPKRDWWNMLYSNQRTQSVVRACGDGGMWESLAWLGSAGVTKGLSMGGDWEGNGMRWHHDSSSGRGRWRREGRKQEGRMNICWRGKYWPFGGPPVNCVWARKQSCSVWVTKRKEDVWECKQEFTIVSKNTVTIIWLRNLNVIILRKWHFLLLIYATKMGNYSLCWMNSIKS